MQSRVGIFGGTFDPPHLGHLILASEAHAQLQLTKLLWVLTAAPPHKVGAVITDVLDRLEMVRRAILGNPAFELSSLDIDRPGPHFTADTLRLARRENADAKLVLVIGGDSLRDIPTWHDPAGVVAWADEIGVMRRPGDEISMRELEKQVPGIGGKIRWVNAPLLDIASHDIRDRRAAGKPIRYYVPQLVQEFIIEKGLYRAP